MSHEKENPVHPEKLDQTEEWLRIPSEQNEVCILTSKELAWAIGVFCGSGSVDKNSIDFNSVNSLFLEYLHEKLCEIFSLPVSKTKFSERVKNGKLSPHLKINSAELAGRVKYLTQAHWAVEIEEHYQWIVNKGYIPYFLAGYFDVKGHIVKNKYLRFSTPNIQSAEKLLYLLEKMGIYGSIESKNINSFTITIYAFSQVRSLISFFHEVDLMYKKEDVLLFDEQLSNTADLNRAVNITSFVRFELYQLLLDKKFSDVASVKFFDQVGLPVSMRNIRRWKNLESSPYTRHTPHIQLIDIALAIDQYLRPKQLNGKEFIELFIQSNPHVFSPGEIAHALEHHVYAPLKSIDVSIKKCLMYILRAIRNSPHSDEEWQWIDKQLNTYTEIINPQNYENINQFIASIQEYERFLRSSIKEQEIAKFKRHIAIRKGMSQKSQMDVLGRVRTRMNNS